MSTLLDPTHLIGTSGSVGIAVVPFVLGVVLVSLVPVGVEALRSRTHRTPEETQA